MIILATDVVSELVRATPEPVVATWARARAPELVHTTALSAAEVGYGIARLPHGRRRDALAAAAEQVFTAFAERVLPFDLAAAAAYGDVVTTRDRAGTPIGAPAISQTLVLSAVLVGLATTWYLTVATVVGRLGPLLTRPLVRAWLDRVTGVVLIGLGVRLALSPRPG